MKETTKNNHFLCIHLNYLAIGVASIFDLGDLEAQSICNDVNKNIQKRNFLSCLARNQGFAQERGLKPNAKKC